MDNKNEKHHLGRRSDWISLYPLPWEGTVLIGTIKTISSASSLVSVITVSAATRNIDGVIGGSENWVKILLIIGE